MTALPPASSNALHLAALVQRHKALIAVQRNAFTLRMHRALSWLQRAEAEKGDDDLGFMCLWIAFNAAYAQDTGSHTDNASERQTFRSFVGEVCRLDANKALPALVWQVFPGPIRVLLDNQYVFQPFWDALNNPRADGSTPTHWREVFDDARQRVHRALAQQDTEKVLYEVFVRLYTLRNQLMHGGATWNSSVNRIQLRDGRELLTRVLPVMLGVMMQNPAHFEGKPFYPVVAN
ncbi:HEPN domain-containing protein [Simplicispira psychrophila]|uniref:HEPN domain-containing protein n=1 Tax=Simplicispira psychrophila TaxID=80882 RepID=UPI00068BF385|nr:HEPN domain-containing protein [Simplicispira psychrophila]